MKQLIKNALARSPVSETDVEEIWSRVKARGTQSLTISTIRILCESHERLRAEVAGAQILIAELEARLESKDNTAWEKSE